MADDEGSSDASGGADGKNNTDPVGNVTPRPGKKNETVEADEGKNETKSANETGGKNNATAEGEGTDGKNGTAVKTGGQNGSGSAGMNASAGNASAASAGVGGNGTGGSGNGTGGSGTGGNASTTAAAPAENGTGATSAGAAGGSANDTTTARSASNDSTAGTKNDSLTTVGNVTGEHGLFSFASPGGGNATEGAAGASNVTGTPAGASAQAAAPSNETKTSAAAVANATAAATANATAAVPPSAANATVASSTSPAPKPQSAAGASAAEQQTSRRVVSRFGRDREESSLSRPRNEDVEDHPDVPPREKGRRHGGSERGWRRDDGRGRDHGRDVDTGRDFYGRDEDTSRDYGRDYGRQDYGRDERDYGRGPHWDHDHDHMREDVRADNDRRNLERSRGERRRGQYYREESSYRGGDSRRSSFDGARQLLGAVDEKGRNRNYRPSSRVVSLHDESSGSMHLPGQPPADFRNTRGTTSPSGPFPGTFWAPRAPAPMSGPLTYHRTAGTEKVDLRRRYNHEEGPPAYNYEEPRDESHWSHEDHDRRSSGPGRSTLYEERDHHAGSPMPVRRSSYDDVRSTSSEQSSEYGHDETAYPQPGGGPTPPENLSPPSGPASARRRGSTSSSSEDRESSSESAAHGGHHGGAGAPPGAPDELEQEHDIFKRDAPGTGTSGRDEWIEYDEDPGKGGTATAPYSEVERGGVERRHGSEAPSGWGRRRSPRRGTDRSRRSPRRGTDRSPSAPVGERIVDWEGSSEHQIWTSFVEIMGGDVPTAMLRPTSSADDGSAGAADHDGPRDDYGLRIIAHPPK